MKIKKRLKIKLAKQSLCKILDIANNKYKSESDVENIKSLCKFTIKIL